MSVREASIGQTEHGLVVEGDGWFVLNAADAVWVRNERGGDTCILESREAPFPEVGTRHVFVGAGDGPCAILTTGARREGEELHYPADKLAAEYGASATEDTTDPREAYREWPSEFKPVRGDWPPSG